MNDAEQGENASGSWQPDPTGRYKLRWQRSTGEWTDHVYSSEGALGSDPYDAPPAPPRSRAPSREGRQVGDSPPTADVQASPQNGRRKLPIAIGMIIAAFIALLIIRSLVSDGNETEARNELDTSVAALIADHGCEDLLSSARSLGYDDLVPEIERHCDSASAVVTTSRNAPRPQPVTLSGSGQDVTRAVNLTEGRWRVRFSINSNTDRSFDTPIDQGVALTVSDSAGEWDLLVNEIAASGSWTSALTVGSDYGALAPGSIWFEIDLVDQSASWRLTVEPL